MSPTNLHQLSLLQVQVPPTAFMRTLKHFGSTKPVSFTPLTLTP